MAHAPAKAAYFSSGRGWNGYANISEFAGQGEGTG